MVNEGEGEEGEGFKCRPCEEVSKCERKTNKVFWVTHHREYIYSTT
jgi:hypothetical protein